MSKVADVREFGDLSPAVRAFISRTQKLYIDGRWVQAVSGKTFDTIDPASEQVICEVAEGGPKMWTVLPKQRTKPFTKASGRA